MIIKHQIIKCCVVAGNGEYVKDELPDGSVYLVIKKPGKIKTFGNSTFSKHVLISNWNGDVAECLYRVATSMLRTMKRNNRINKKVVITLS